MGMVTMMRMRVGVKSIDPLWDDDGKSSSDQKASTQHRYQVETIFGQGKGCNGNSSIALSVAVTYRTGPKNKYSLKELIL